MSERQGEGGRPAAADVAVRTAAATLGAYGVAYVLTALLAAALARLGSDRVDAAIVRSSVGLLVFPAVSIWAFAERRLAAVGLATAVVTAALVAAVVVLRP